jgi:hypothetical protein
MAKKGADELLEKLGVPNDEIIAIHYSLRVFSYRINNTIDLMQKLYDSGIETIDIFDTKEKDVPPEAREQMDVIKKQLKKFKFVAKHQKSFLKRITPLAKDIGEISLKHYKMK